MFVRASLGRFMTIWSWVLFVVPGIYGSIPTMTPLWNESTASRPIRVPGPIRRRATSALPLVRVHIPILIPTISIVAPVVVAVAFSSIVVVVGTSRRRSVIVLVASSGMPGFIVATFAAWMIVVYPTPFVASRWRPAAARVATMPRRAVSIRRRVSTMVSVSSVNTVSSSRVAWQ